MKKYKVFVVGGDYGYAKLFIDDVEISTSIEDSDIVLFTGGSDVSPSVYGQSKGSRTHCDIKRDSSEGNIFSKAYNMNKFMLGVCRGAQFLTVMSGGSLIQDVSGHTCGKHMINIVKENRDIEMTSTHHQMMYPFDLNKDSYEIIAKSSRKLSEKYLNGEDSEIFTEFKDFVEPEIVWYNKTRCLCIQGHPEYMGKDSKAVKFVNLLIEEYMELCETQLSGKIEAIEEPARIFLNPPVQVRQLRREDLDRMIADIDLGREDDDDFLI